MTTPQIHDIGDKTICAARPSLVRPEDARYHFGLERKTIYNLVNSGALRRGHHYIKKGTALLLVYDAFLEFLFEEDKGHGNPR